MEDLIKALQIFLKYGNHQWPTWCEHDMLHIVGISPADVSEDDKAELDRLGFHEDGTEFYSHRYGSS